MPNMLYLGLTHASSSAIAAKLYAYRGPIGCDVETISLEDRTPLGAAFAISPTESFYFKMDHPLFPWSKLADPGIEIIFHNSGFDIDILEMYRWRQQLKHKHDEVVTNYKDSLIAAQLAGLPNKLGELCQELFDRQVRPISDLIGEPPNVITMDKVPFEKVAERGCRDAQDCLEVWLHIHSTLPQRALDLETRVLPVAINMQRKGIRIDRGAVSEHRLRLERKAVFLKTICEGKGFNPGSSMQLAAQLESQGYKVPYNRKTGKPKLDKEILETFYNVVPDAVMTLQYRSTQTLLTHLIKPLDEGRYIVEDKIYPRVNLDVARSGRLSRSKPATQNINDALRNIIIPSDGNMLYDADRSQIELRWAGYIWEDTTIQAIFARGEDVHQGTANELIKEGLGGILGPTAATQRRIAKDTNFAMLFGGDEDTLFRRKQVPVDIGRRLIAAYFNRFKGIANGIQKTVAFAKANGYTETYLGRRRYEIEKLESGKDYLVAAAIRELVNHVIQGSAAETMKEWMWVERNEPVFHTVHDSLIYDAPVDWQYTGMLHKVTPFNAPYRMKVGDNWRDVK